MSMRPDWVATKAKAADTYFKSVRDANKAAVTYQQSLKNLTINDQARKTLDTQLTFHILGHTTTVLKDAARLEPRLAKLRQ